MDKTICSLTVLFEGSFWVGIFERTDDGKFQVCKVTFGTEPKDYEVWDFILKHYLELKYSPAIETEIKQTADNPKRRSRNARKQLKNLGTGTKSQQVLQKQREEIKIERRKISKKQREAEKKHQFELKQKKRKEKHKGH